MEPFFLIGGNSVPFLCVWETPNFKISVFNVYVEAKQINNSVGIYRPFFSIFITASRIWSTDKSHRPVLSSGQYRQRWSVVNSQVSSRLDSVCVGVFLL